MTDNSSQPMNETVDGELLPCPFCGEPASMTSFERDIGGSVKVRITQIQCTNEDVCKVCVDVQHINEAVAIEEWNTRDAQGRPDRVAVARALCRQYELDDGFSQDQADRAAASEMHRNFLKAADAAIAALSFPSTERGST